MNKEQIGENTGIVWLTRENKICFSPERGVMYFEVYHEYYY